MFKYLSSINTADVLVFFWIFFRSEYPNKFYWWVFETVPGKLSPCCTLITWKIIGDIAILLYIAIAILRFYLQLIFLIIPDLALK